MLIDISFQGKCQVYVFHLLIKVGFLPFYMQRRFFKFNVKVSGRRVQDLAATTFQVKPKEASHIKMGETHSAVNETLMSASETHKPDTFLMSLYAIYLNFTTQYFVSIWKL